MRVYVASSWRNEHQQGVVSALRRMNHEVYDFRDHGFSWRTVSGDWLSWTPTEYIAGMAHPEAERGFKRDMDALHWCDALVMVMPCGPSAALELGWAAGAGKPTAVYMPGIREPDLMIKVADLLTTQLPDVLGWLSKWDDRRAVLERDASAAHASPERRRTGSSVERAIMNELHPEGDW